MGAQALITRRLVANADLSWIWLGAVLPDLPWILQRVVKALPTAISPIDLRLYTAVQSSLLFCVIAAAAFALLTRRPTRVFAIVAMGCLLHLLLDAMQTKWANGVLLAAPLDWRLLNLSFFWPENWPSHLLSLLGIGYVVWAAWRIGPGAFRPARLPVWRWIAVVALFALYFSGPFALMPKAEAANLHFAGTFRDVAARPGHEVAFDRAKILGDRDGCLRLTIWTGETLCLVGLPIPPSAHTVSVRGRFVDAETVEVAEIHLHSPGRRDMITIFGLGIVIVWWSVAFRKVVPRFWRRIAKK